MNYLKYVRQKASFPLLILLMGMALTMLAPAETVVEAQGSLLPAPLPVSPDPRFGIVEAYLHPDYANAAGAGWTRVHFGWGNGLQRSRDGDLNPFYFGSGVMIDEVLTRELNANRQPVGLLIETPDWAGGGHQHNVPSGLDYPYNDPNNLWGQFVKQVVEEYGDKVKHWIIWNEPDICSNDGNTKQWNGDARQYAKLLKVGYQAAKSVDPNATILMAATTFWWDEKCGREDLTYISQVLNAIKSEPGNQDYFDAVALNLYLDPDQIYKIIRDYRSLLQREGFNNKELWLTETNVQFLNQQVPYGNPPYYMSREEQAYFLVQTWAMAMAGGANRMEYFKMKDDPAEWLEGQPYGMINPDGSLGPAFWSYRTIVTYLGGFKRATLQNPLDKPVRYLEKGTRVVVVEREQGWTTVVWNRENTEQTVEVQAHANSALLVDPFGPIGRVNAVNGRYTLRLPPPEDAYETDDRIGSRPYLLVEGAGANVLLARPSQYECDICQAKNENIAPVLPLSQPGASAQPQPEPEPEPEPEPQPEPQPSSPSSEEDWQIPNGHFYTQTGGEQGGFSVVDNGEARLWSEFQRLGGLQTVGYPISRRYEKDGFVTQAFQKLILQWRPEVGQVWPVNVFDELSKSGFDQTLLLTRQIPRALDSNFDPPGGSWPEIVAKRQALLDQNPAIRDAYFSVPNPLNVFGLPASQVTDMDNHYALRTQRAVFQQWKQDVPWANAGQVTIANGGDIAKELGWLSPDYLQPEPLSGN
ncbi:MAG: glycosyl hydrolase [Ardenticatenaceae bacterium]